MVSLRSAGLLYAEYTMIGPQGGRSFSSGVRLHGGATLNGLTPRWEVAFRGLAGRNGSSRSSAKTFGSMIAVITH
jgi:hypothetical protein